MMLRTLVDEIVPRRLWPVAAVAVAVVAAPLLFLKPASQPAAPSTAIVPAPAQADLPARARQLLATTDASGASERRLSRSARDPFQSPAARGKAASGAKASSSKKTSTKTATTKAAKADEPVRVVVTNADGSSSGAASPAATSAGAGRTSTARSTSRASAPASESSAATTVDVRFGARKDSPIMRRIPRLKTFTVGGKIVVVFVKWSPKRDKAVFAITPSTTVRGSGLHCRRTDGLCRYVDIPAGKYARLTFVAGDGSRVSRRLDVVRVHGHA
jgi:hypothetical protein